MNKVESLVDKLINEDSDYQKASDYAPTVHTDINKFQMAFNKVVKSTRALHNTEVNKMIMDLDKKIDTLERYVSDME